MVTTTGETRPTRAPRSASTSDKVFAVVNGLFIAVVVVLVGYPLVYVLSASISDPDAVSSGKMWLWPVDITFRGFSVVLDNSAIWRGYLNTIVYTVVGVALHLAVLLPAAYALSRKDLPGRRLISLLILFTMLFNGGLIPTYLVVKNLGMLDTLWAIVLPNLVNAWSILVARAFFASAVPEALVESARMDGASDIRIFFRIALPLSAPIIAVMALLHGVSLWNEYFRALIYLSDPDKYPLQLILRQILVVNQAREIGQGGGAVDNQSLAEQLKTASLVKYAVMIVASLPLLVIYPFLQRFFVKGVLVGSVKE